MKAAPRIWIFLASLIAVVVCVAWANDQVPLEGERTVYTVQCSGGNWESAHCTGGLVDAERFRFRALRAHREVLFGAKAQLRRRYRPIAVAQPGDLSCGNAAKAVVDVDSMTHAVDEPQSTLLHFTATCRFSSRCCSRRLRLAGRTSPAIWAAVLSV